MELNNKNLGARIRNLREDKNITITALANEVGIERPTLGNIEHGRKGPSLEVAVKLSQFFDVSLDYLLCLTDDPTHHR